MRWLDKLIEELKWKFWDKYDIDWMQSQIKKMHEAPMPPMPEDGVAVVEIEAVPVEEVEVEWCPEHWPECDGKECEDKPESWEAEEPKLPEEAEWETYEQETEEPKETETLEDATPAEEDRMQEILNAIKTFFPNENTEDVLVRIVQKLIDR